MINVIRLKAGSKKELIDFLYNVFGVDENEDLITLTDKFWCHVVGVLRVAEGETLIDDDGYEYKNFVDLPGYHANVVSSDNEIIESLKPLTVKVDNPLIKVCGE